MKDESTKPSYEELVACICGMVLQHCVDSRFGDRIDTFALSANEDALDILQRLGIVGEDDRFFGEVPLTEDDVRTFWRGFNAGRTGKAE
jgi:hypothetical protein